MALEQATYINQLNSGNPGATDTVAQADDHLRLIKSVLKSTFPNITGAVTATQTQINDPVPSGLIAMWSGSVIPTGWNLCDGTNDTPDLRGRFIIGVNSTHLINTTGGSISTSTAGSHTHGMTGSGSHNHTGVSGSTVLTVDNIPAHSHTWSGVSTSEDNNYTAGPSKYLKEGSTANNASFTETTSNTGGGLGHTHTISTEGEHAHSLIADGTHSHSTEPPYYALAYIMKA